MNKINFYCTKYYYTLNEKFNSFIDDHNMNLWDISHNCIDLEYARQIFEHLNYSIEISEISNAKMGDCLDKKNWARTHTYRWDITYWDKEGNFVTHKISDSVDHKPYIGYDYAMRGAIDYIVENYKEIESC